MDIISYVYVSYTICGFNLKESSFIGCDIHRTKDIYYGILLIINNLLIVSSNNRLIVQLIKHNYNYPEAQSNTSWIQQAFLASGIECFGAFVCSDN